MGPATADDAGKRQPASGSHERQLAIGSTAQQIAQVVALLSMLAAITVVARRLTLGEFGTYGLLVSLTAYVLFLRSSVTTAAVKAIAEASGQAARDAAFSTAMSLSAAAGLVGGALIAGVGSAALGLFNIPAEIQDDAQLSVLSLAAVTALGWPISVFQDVLRGSQNFVLSAAAEIVAHMLVAATLVGLAVPRAPLWLLVAAGGAIPLVNGIASGCIVWWKRLPYRFRPSKVTAASVRGLLSLSSYLSLIGLAGLAIYATDRAILAAFRSPATVGLYEGPVRAHNLLQQVQRTCTIPVLPAAARYLAEGDELRTRELLLRGTRYTLAAVVPLTVVLMILAGPILELWLGAEFGAAATAMALFVGYWLINANTGVASSMLVTAGRIRQLTLYAAAVAVLNLALSLALTPSLGLNGVVLGTTLSYLLGFPFFFAIVLDTFAVSLADFAREAWLPAYATGVVVAGGLISARLLLPFESLAEVLAGSTLALLAYWTLYYVVWLRPGERILVRDVAWALVRR